MPTIPFWLIAFGFMWGVPFDSRKSPGPAGATPPQLNITTSTQSGFFHVYDYGFIGDQVSDEGPAINRAIVACNAAGGGVVQLPRGLIMVSTANKVLVLSGVFVRGMGVGKTIVRRTSASSTSNEFWKWGNNVTLQSYLGTSDLTLDGNRASTTQSGTAPMSRIQKASYVWLTNLELLHSQLQNFASDNANYVFCRDIYSHDCNRDAFSFYNNCSYVDVVNFVAERSGDDGLAFVSYDAGECQYCTASNIVLNSCGMNDGTGSIAGGGLKVAGAKYISISGAVTNGCANGTLIQSNETKKAQFVTITGLVSSLDGQNPSGSNKCGVSILNGCSYISVQGRIDAAKTNGAQISSGSDIVLDLAVSNCLSHGVALLNIGTITRVVIRGSSYFNQQCGYTVVSSTDVELIGCQSLNNNQGANTESSGNGAGLSIQSSSRLTVTGGCFADTQGVSSTQQNGINLQTGTIQYVTLAGVRITGNKASGVRLNGTQSDVLIDGELSENGGHGLLMNTDVTRMIVRGKAIKNQKNGYMIRGTNIEMVGCQSLNNNQGANISTSGNSSGLTVINSTTGLTITGGEYSDTQGGSATQQNGICFQTGTIAQVSITGPRMEGNINAAMLRSVVPTLFRAVNAYGYVSGAKDILEDYDGIRVIQGTGSPEGVCTSGIGGEYRRTDGGAGTSHYFKETGTGNTGWVGK